MMSTNVAPVVILLSGYLGSGKDTVGLYLSTYGFKRYAFADALKDEIANTYSLSRAAMDTQQGKRETVHLPNGTVTTVRRLLISHGQMRRAQDINYWVTRVGKNVADSDNDKRIVITDWRFPNEYQHLVKLLQKTGANWNVLAVRIDRWSTPPLMDESELALDSFPFSFIIDNKRGDNLLNLQNNVDQFVWSSVTGFSWLIIDVDDVLLDWMSGFREFLTHIGLTTRGPLPQTWDLSSWIVGRGAANVDVNTLVRRFNSSRFFAELMPLPNAAKLLLEAKEHGWTVIALTACLPNTSSETRSLRERNLERCFVPSIARVICLPLGAKKDSVYRMFPGNGRVIVVDDTTEHVCAAIRAGHEGILFQRPWTRSAMGCDTVSNHEQLSRLLIIDK